jgi:hypothetical protein
MSVLSLPLDALAEAINREHDACTEALRSALDHAIEAGRMLSEVKATLPHGGFLPWVRDHCRFGERMAQRYMKAAEWRSLNPTRETDLSLRQVLAELAESTPKATPMLERHPVNESLPAMTPEEFDRLKASIARVGLIHPIMVHEGRILDGWHRYRACLETGTEPSFETYLGTEAGVGWRVNLLNVSRQHLSDTETAEFMNAWRQHLDPSAS